MKTLCSAIPLALCLAASPASAQEGKPETRQDHRPTQDPSIPLHLDVVLSRTDGDRQVSRLPYTLALTSGGRTDGARVRMGLEVPIRVKEDTGAIQYDDVGNNLECWASALGDGLFRVTCRVEQKSVYQNRSSAQAGDDPQAIPSVPILRTFSASGSLILRDRQTGVYSSAADPISGEVLRIETTLHVFH